MDQVRQLIGAWATDYNTARPQSSLGCKTPAVYAGTLTAPKGLTSAEALTAVGRKFSGRSHGEQSMPLLSFRATQSLECFLRRD